MSYLLLNKSNNIRFILYKEKIMILILIIKVRETPNISPFFHDYYIKIVYVKSFKIIRFSLKIKIRFKYEKALRNNFKYKKSYILSQETKEIHYIFLE